MRCRSVTAVENLANDIKENPDLAKCKFRLEHKWVNRDYNHSTVGDFYFESVIKPQLHLPQRDLFVLLLCQR